MTLLHRTDHVERGLARLLGQFQRSDRLRAVLTSYLTQVQNLEDALWEVITERYLANAAGAQLDVLARLVRARGRGALLDDDFRTAIRCQIRINRSVGRPSDICDVASLSLGADATITYRERYPASVEVSCSDAAEVDPRIVRDNLRSARGGGVRLSYYWTPSGYDSSLVFCPYQAGGYDTPTLSATQGLAWESGSDGGAMSGVLE